MSSEIPVGSMGGSSILKTLGYNTDNFNSVKDLYRSELKSLSVKAAAMTSSGVSSVTLGLGNKE
jgi:hypothetical protein